jgi:hypothetical protein
VNDVMLLLLYFYSGFCRTGFFATRTLSSYDTKTKLVAFVFHEVLQYVCLFF